jgi:PAS domain S-box-containing protein
VWVNPAVKQMTGYSIKECLAMADYPLPLVYKDDREDVAKVVRRFLKDRTSGHNLPFRIRRKDGSIIWAAMSWQPICNAKGAYQGIRSSIHDITERIRKEEQILRQSTVLNGIKEVFHEALTCESDADVARTCLAVAERLTSSKFGFIGEVNQAGLFDTIAISNPGWDACKMPNSKATRLIKGMQIRGIWSRAITDEQSLIVNEPRSHPDRVRLPRGHPPLKCFLGVPLKQRAKTIGMIALANKESGYESGDQEAVEALSVAFVEALMRKRAEKKAQPH